VIVTVFLVYRACLRVLERGKLGHHLGHLSITPPP